MLYPIHFIYGHNNNIYILRIQNINRTIKFMTNSNLVQRSGK